MIIDQPLLEVIRNLDETPRWIRDYENVQRHVGTVAGVGRKRDNVSVVTEGKISG